MVCSFAGACDKQCIQETEFFCVPCAEHFGAYGFLFAQNPSKRFRFSVRDNPLRFISLNLIFSASIGLIFPLFKWALKRGHHISCFKVSASIIVFGELLTKQNSINGFFERQRVFLSPVYRVSLEMLKVLPLLDSTSFNWAVCLCNICQAFFPASFRQIKWNFRTFSTFLIVHCVSSFWRSISSITFLRSLSILLNLYWQRLWLTGAEIFGKRISFAYDFLEKIFENPGFFTRQLSLCRLLWSSFFFMAPQGWLRLGIKNVGWFQEFSVKCSDFFARC